MKKVRVAALPEWLEVPTSSTTLHFQLVNESLLPATVFLFAYDTSLQIFRSVNLHVQGEPQVPECYRYHFAQQFIVYPLKIQPLGEVAVVADVKAGLIMGMVPHPDLIPQHLPSLQHESKGNLLELALCSMVFMMGLYIVLKYVQLRTKEYGFYALYILFTFLHFLVVMLAKSWVAWYEDAETRIFYHRLFQLLSHVAYFQFFRHFTRTFVHQPVFDKVLRVATVVGLALAVIDAGLVFVWQPVGFNYGFAWIVVRVGFSLFVVVSLALWVARSTSPLRKYLIAGNSFLILGGILTMLWNAFPAFIATWPGPLSHSLFYFRAGVLLELLFFSLGLGFKQRLDEKRRQEAESRLEKERLELEKVREVDAAKSSFFTNISHEFRTPLSLIQGPAEKIARDSNGRYQREVDTIVHHSQSLVRLVDQMLELSKLEAGKWKLQVKWVSINAFFKRITESFAYYAAQKQQQWRLELPLQEMEVCIDPYLTEAVVQNLFSNAVKYTPPDGCISLHVRVVDGELIIIMKDNGLGIAPEILNKIFDRFYRVEGTDQPGTGVGLTLVRELVRLHKGTIKASSEPGYGSAFTVQLCCDPACFDREEWSSDNEENKQVGIPAVPMAPKKGNLLVLVEDNTELRSFLIDVLKDDFTIQPVQAATPAWELIRSQLPDLVLTDWMMPGESGLDLCRKIKEDSLTNHIPVAMLTARASEQSRLEGWQGGADDYIAKPFSVEELRARLRNLIVQRERLRAKYAADIASGVKTSVHQDAFLKQVQEVIYHHLSDSSFSVDHLARAVGVSRVQLYRKVTATTPHGPGELIRQARLEEAARLLRNGQQGVAEVAYATGFESASHFARVYREKFGFSPSETPINRS
ncbi:MAG: ATP-binding protein [Bacteroidota bacterium]